MRFGEGHEHLMRQAAADFETQGGKLPPDVQLDWLILGNVRTDIANIQPDKRVPAWDIVIMAVRGASCKYGDHPAHAMRCRKQKVAEAYPLLRETIRRGFTKGCVGSLSWEDRALAFGSALHTLQDSYCVAHAGRVDNAVPTSPIIAMYPYPSKQHPITTRRDNVWQDAGHTAFKPEAAAAITATVAALHIFVSQSVDGIDAFLDHYLAFREDIAETLHPV